jgi:hypothetical protein
VVLTEWVDTSGYAAGTEGASNRIEAGDLGGDGSTMVRACSLASFLVSSSSPAGWNPFAFPGVVWCLVMSRTGAKLYGGCTHGSACGEVLEQQLLLARERR